MQSLPFSIIFSPHLMNTPYNRLYTYPPISRLCGLHRVIANQVHQIMVLTGWIIDTSGIILPTSHHQVNEITEQGILMHSEMNKKDIRLWKEG